MAATAWDAESFAKTFALPLMASAVFVLHSVTVDTFAVGAARTPYQLKYPFTSENFSDARLLEPFLRAYRAQQNHVEQAWAFFMVMWLCALAWEARFAGIWGCVWVVSRIGYGYLYRVSPSRNKLMYFTIPAYLAKLSCSAGILAAILPVAFADLGRLQSLSAAYALASGFFMYGWCVYRTWFQSFVESEKELLEDGV
eukprot:TRINITY_DN106542_c0_g1_i1.p1 TRINITY_DN106542_c0_g1~~TRINITY_DN106542_c0_g1_i1.p1  ORF type:complete len:198 (+),score=16.33 TRINITY_DN106542_c0_g1_i1:140-733(+)